MKKKAIGIFILFSFLAAIIAPFKAIAATTPGTVNTDTTNPCKDFTAPTFGSEEDTRWWDIGDCAFREKVENAPASEIFGERYTYAQVRWILNSLVTILMPSKTTKNVGDTFNQLFSCGLNKNCATNTPAPTPAPPATKIMFTPVLSSYGLPGLLVGMIGDTMLNPPASGIDTTRDTLAKFDLATPAYAQGYGYRSLSGIQVIWAASRNLAYLLMIVVLIAAGFMIMFRVKINPQTAVSLQMMIPKIIITLIAVTFSYAIAGFMIDLVYVFLSFVVSLLGTVGLLNAGLAISNFVQGGYYQMVLFFVLPYVFMIVLGGPIAFMTNTPALALGAGAAMTIANIIILIASIWLLWKVYWLLLRTYFNVIIQIIVGPWQILMGLLPTAGKSAGLGPWIKSLTAQLSVFVTIPLMFLLALLLWTPPFGVDVLTNVFRSWAIGSSAGAIGSQLPSLPLLGTTGPIFQMFVAFIILSLTPKAAEIVRDNISKGMGLESGVGEAFGFATGFVGGRISNEAQKGQGQISELQKALQKRMFELRGSMPAGSTAADFNNKLAQDQQYSAISSSLARAQSANAKWELASKIPGLGGGGKKR